MQDSLIVVLMYHSLLDWYCSIIVLKTPHDGLQLKNSTGCLLKMVKDRNELTVLYCQAFSENLQIKALDMN